MMKELTLSINKEQILSSEGIVMHNWETPIMEKKAQWVCQNGGDILEIGFGMGISADFIQSHDIKSHTICEIHPQVLSRLRDWARNKPNVIILEGDWYDNIPNMKKYDGILYDTYRDYKHSEFKKLIPRVANPNCNVTWWNNTPETRCEHKLQTTTFDIIEVDPPQNDYFNHKNYYMPKYTYNA